jgi:hypothetical protein
VTIPQKADANEGDLRNLRKRIGELARRVIDLEKPAHTTYELALSSASEAPEIEISDVRMVSDGKTIRKSLVEDEEHDGRSI